MLLIGIFHIGRLIKPRSVILALGLIFLLIDQEYITQGFSVEYIVQFQFRKSSMDVIEMIFGAIDFLPNYFFSAQLKLRAAAYNNHLQYKQLLLVAKVSCQFIKPDASVIL